MALTEQEKYQKYHSSPLAIKRRSERNKARRKAEKVWGKKAIKGKDIDHKNTNPGGNLSNDIKNIRITTVHYNRGKDANSWRKTKKRNH